MPQNSSKLRKIATPNLYLGTGQKSGQSELDHTPQQGKLIGGRLAVPLNDFRNIGKNGGGHGGMVINGIQYECFIYNSRYVEILGKT